MEIPLTMFDFAVLGILMVSGLIASYRGFLNESLSVAAWAVAALAAVFLSPIAKPFARSLIEPKWLADGLGILSIFLLLLIPLSFISFRVSEMARETPIGPLNRSLGFVFGVARGLLIVGLAYLVFTLFAPAAKTHPEWVREARLLPVVKGTAELLRSLGGGKIRLSEEKDASSASPGAKTGAKPKSARATNGDDDNNEGSGDKGKTYDDGDRRAMDQLVRSTSKP
jgi:membrane protein required for colicin V production